MAATYLNAYSEQLARRSLGSDLVALDAQFNNSVDLTNVCLEFVVGSLAGDVKVTTLAGTTLVIPNMQIGQKNSVPVTRIWSNGTTAAGLTGTI